MKKSFLASIAFITLALISCDNHQNGITPDPTGTTYPRVQLIEHFTGEACGYCPYGMDLIYDVYSADPDQYVWISNHTYGKDAYTITESNTVAKKLGVNSAPAISINRTKHSSSRNYHPYYIEDYMAQEATTATSVLFIDRTYDASTNELVVRVTGKTSDTSVDSVMLTLAVTESGLVGPQQDYYATWEGWKQFTHTHAVRTYLTAALGDNVQLKNRTFAAEYKTTLASGWNAENCMVVGWITPNNTPWPVLNAAKTPVVDGTQGGEDIRHGGIEENPVSDTYPESGAPLANAVMKQAGVVLSAQSGYTIAVLDAYNQDTTLGKYSGYSMFPYIELLVALPAGSTSLPNGTYNVVESSSAQVGDVLAGIRNDETHSIDGSQFLYTVEVDGSIYIAKQWMVVSGTLTVSDEGFAFDGTTKNGSPIHAEYAGSMSTKTASAPRRIMPLNEPKPVLKGSCSQ